MHWQENGATQTIPSQIKVVLLRESIKARPDKPALYVDLGKALLEQCKFEPAAEAFEAAAKRDPDGFLAWADLAQCYAQLDRLEEALDICDRGAGRRPSGPLCFERGRTLHKMRRPAEARVEFDKALMLGDETLNPLKALLRPLARHPDGGVLLAYCDGLDPYYRNTALVRAHRAIALSRLRRTEEAMEIVALDRHVARVAFEPPRIFGGIGNFNRILSEELLRYSMPETHPGSERDLTYAPHTYRRPALSALLTFVRDAMTDYVGQVADRGLAAVLPPPPEEATLFVATAILRRDGSNGEHVHPRGYVSTVYHALVPDSVSKANDLRGSLALGACERYTGGYRPCWGTRYIKPVAGWLTLFPSHMFHDVVPSRSENPRISVSSDLWPTST